MNSLKIHDFHTLIDNLIDINKSIRKTINDNKYNQVSSIAYAMEFCTVRVDIGRRTGKTEYIKKHINSNSIVICHSHGAVKEFQKYRDTMVFVPGQLLETSLRKISNMEINMVYIDEPSYVFNDRSHMISIYNMILKYNKGIIPTFVLLGQ